MPIFSPLLFQGERWIGISECFTALAQFYKLIQQTEFTDDDINVIHPLRLQFIKSVKAAFPSEWEEHIFCRLKIHLLYHLEWFIQSHGSPRLTSTQVFESAHKYYFRENYINQTNRQYKCIAYQLVNIVHCLLFCELFCLDISPTNARRL